MFKKIFRVLVTAVAFASLVSVPDVSAASLTRSQISAKVTNGEYLIYDRNYLGGISSSIYSSLIDRYGTISKAASTGALGTLYYGNYNNVYNTLYGSYLNYSSSTWKDVLGKSEYKRLKKKYGSISKAIAEGAVSGYSYSSLYDINSRLYRTVDTSALRNALYIGQTDVSLDNIVRTTSGSYVDPSSWLTLYNTGSGLYIYR